MCKMPTNRCKRKSSISYTICCPRQQPIQRHCWQLFSYCKSNFVQIVFFLTLFYHFTNKSLPQKNTLEHSHKSSFPQSICIRFIYYSLFRLCLCDFCVCLCVLFYFNFFFLHLFLCPDPAIYFLLYYVCGTHKRYTHTHNALKIETWIKFKTLHLHATIKPKIDSNFFLSEEKEMKKKRNK